MFPFIHRVFRDNGHHHFIDRLADANSIISAVALYPQLVMALDGHSLDVLSPTTFFLTALNSGIWVLYGMHRKEAPLAISSAVNGLAALAILILIFIHR
jgi:uncharacterized protein with PQ loop repeat